MSHERAEKLRDRMLEAAVAFVEKHAEFTQALSEYQGAVRASSRSIAAAEAEVKSADPDPEASDQAVLRVQRDVDHRITLGERVSLHLQELNAALPRLTLLFAKGEASGRVLDAARAVVDASSAQSTAADTMLPDAAGEPQKGWDETMTQRARESHAAARQFAVEVNSRLLRRRP